MTEYTQYTDLEAFIKLKLLELLPLLNTVQKIEEARHKTAVYKRLVELANADKS